MPKPTWVCSGIHLRRYVRPVTTFEVTSGVGTGPVALAAPRSDVHRAMGRPNNVERLTDEHSSQNRDFFHSNAFQVFYDARDRVEYVELSLDPTFRVVLQGRPVLLEPADQIITWAETLWRLDRTDKEFPYSAVFPDVDLAFWRPTVPEPGAPIDTEGQTAGLTFETVGVGIPGYFRA